MVATVGVDRYHRWPRLRNAVNDAAVASDVFRRLGFEQAVPPLLDGAATADALQSLVHDDLSRLDADDSLVVFFAGHGHSMTRTFGDGTRVQTGYLVPVDGERDRPSGWLELDSWLSDVARLPPKHILVILDACHSGVALGSAMRGRERLVSASNRDALAVLSQRRSRRVITSALADQHASEVGPVAGLSLFTGCLIEGLEGGISSHGGLVTGSELGQYLQRRVSSYPSAFQTPDFGALELDDRGEILIPTLAAETQSSERDLREIILEPVAPDVSDIVELGPATAIPEAWPRAVPDPEGTDVDRSDAGQSATRATEVGVGGGERRLPPAASGGTKGAPSDDHPGCLYWNIGFPTDNAVMAKRVIFTGVSYALETALQDTRAPKSLSQACFKTTEILAGATQIPVRFVIETRGALVRLPGTQDWLDSVTSGGLTCDAHGTEVFGVEIEARDPGNVSITITLHVREAIVLREIVAVTAVRISDGNFDSGPSYEPSSRPIEISHAALAAVPEAAVVLRLERSGDAYRLRCAGGGLEDKATLYTHTTIAELAKLAIDKRKKLVALSRQYRSAQTSEDDPFAGLRPADDGEALLAVARIGRELHGLLFGDPYIAPADLTRVANVIREHGRDTTTAPRMQVDAETVPFPWGIVYDADGPLDRVTDVTVSGFWGRRFVIDRTVAAVLERLPPATLDGQILPCLNPHLDTEENLKVVASQRSFFGAIRRPAVRPAVESAEQLCDFLRAEGRGNGEPDDKLSRDGDSSHNETECSPTILYFFCHARAAHEVSDQLFQNPAPADEQATLLLDAKDSHRELSVCQLKDIRKAPLKAQPLVFLNACSSAEADQYYQSQFLTLFVARWKARTFIGSDWKIPTEFADAFARRALQRFLGCGCDPALPKLPLGAAFHTTAVEVLELKNPFPLIYALYGRPELQAT
ncbi:MAG TPA: caspase family protein [Kofleriaceae bacterium]|nr:caspase family protein [Kofleriaceae bacterium]